MAETTTKQMRRRWLLFGLNVLGLMLAIGVMLIVENNQAKKRTSSAASQRLPAALSKPDPVVVTPAQVSSNETDIEQQTKYPLHRAIHRQDHERILSLIADSVSLNAPDDAGDTPLHVAVSRKHLHLTAALLVAGAVPNVLNTKSETPLSLLPKRTNPSWRDQFELMLDEPVAQSESIGLPTAPNLAQSALIVAAKYEAAESIAQALNEGADIDLPLTPDGQRLLHYAANANATTVLVQAGANLDLVDLHGTTALMVAAEAGHEAQVQVLLGAGAGVNFRDTRHLSALSHAISAGQGGYSSIVSRLLQAGSDVSSRDWQLAVAERQGKMVRILLREGKEFSPATPEGQHILRQAQMHGGPRVLAALQEHRIIGPALRDRDEEQAQERVSQMERVVRFITPHLTLFFTVLVLMPVLVALPLFGLFEPGWRRWAIAVLLSTTAAYLLLLPLQFQHAISEMRYLGERIGGILIVAYAGVGVFAAVSAAVLVSILTAVKPQTMLNNPFNRPWVAGSSLLVLFVVLLLHHVDRIHFLNRAYIGMTGLPGAAEPAVDRSSEIPMPPKKKWFWQAADKPSWFDTLFYGDLDQVAEALQRGQNPDEQDSLEQTALHHAASAHSVWLTQLLLDHGADPNAMDRNVNLPLCRVMSLAREDRDNSEVRRVAALLISHGALLRHPQCAPIHRTEDLDNIRWLMQQGADIEGRMPAKSNAETQYGQVTALWRAAKTANLVQAKNLLALNAAIDAPDSASGYTPLHVALAEIQTKQHPHPNQKAIVHLLLAQGADTQAAALDGTTVQALDRHKLLRELAAVE